MEKSGLNPGKLGRDERALKTSPTSSQPLIMASCRISLALVSSTLSRLTKHIFQNFDRSGSSIFHG